MVYLNPTQDLCKFSSSQKMCIMCSFAPNAGGFSWIQLFNSGDAFICNPLWRVSWVFNFYHCKQFANEEFPISNQFQTLGSEALEDLPDVNHFARGICPVSLMGKLPDWFCSVQLQVLNTKSLCQV